MNNLDYLNRLYFYLRVSLNSRNAQISAQFAYSDQSYLKKNEGNFSKTPERNLRNLNYRNAQISTRFRSIIHFKKAASFFKTSNEASSRKSNRTDRTMKKANKNVVFSPSRKREREKDSIISTLFLRRGRVKTHSHQAY